MTNIRRITSMIYRTINLSDIKQALCFSISIKTKSKVNIISEVYVNTIVSIIWGDLYSNTSVYVNRNVFVEVSHTGRRFNLVVFDHDLYNKSIQIGDSNVDIDLPNGTSIAHPKVTPLLYGGNNFLYSTTNYCGFVITVNNVAKNHIEKKYIHDEYHIILIYSVKSLIYAPFHKPHFQEPIHQHYGNLPCSILALDWVWVPSLINNTFEIKMIFHNDDEFVDYHHIITANTTYEHFKGHLGLITIDCTKDTFKYFTHLVSTFIFLPLKRYFKYRFSKINFLRLTGGYPTNNPPSSKKGIGWH